MVSQRRPYEEIASALRFGIPSTPSEVLEYLGLRMSDYLFNLLLLERLIVAQCLANNLKACHPALSPSKQSVYWLWTVEGILKQFARLTPGKCKRPVVDLIQGLFASQTRERESRSGPCQQNEV